MDKYEYKIKADEIKSLIAKKEYVKAVKIADTIDWNRVKSVMMLCTISDLYKINRRFEESKALLLMAYDRHPGGRTILYSLCELSIKMGEVVQAVEYYKEFVQMAPNDSGRYILQYKLYEAQEVTLEERIAVLEELKKRDYREKWAYELAYLYHRVGLGMKCVEECDELILWFGEGRYVIKAMELKMLHQPLSKEQRIKYDSRFEPEEKKAPVEESEESVVEDTAEDSMQEQEFTEEPEAMEEVTAEQNPEEVPAEAAAVISDSEIDNIHVKTVDVSQYNTINIQEQLAASMKELLEGSEEGTQETAGASQEAATDSTQEQEPEEVTPVEEEAVYEETELTNEDNDAVQQDDQEVSMDTISMDTISLTQVLNDYSEDDLPPEIAAYGNALASMADGKTQLLDVTGAAVMNELKVESLGAKGVGYAFDDYDNPEQNDMFGEQSQSLYSYGMGDVSPYSFSEEGAPLPSLDSRQGILRQASPRVMDRIIGMEYDGQLNFVVPEAEKIEKQITGQLSIDDILLEWEKTKKENQEKREEDVRQRVLEQTGNMFKEFDEATKAGLLEQLQAMPLTDEDIIEEEILVEDLNTGEIKGLDEYEENLEFINAETDVEPADDGEEFYEEGEELYEEGEELPLEELYEEGEELPSEELYEEGEELPSEELYEEGEELPSEELYEEGEELPSEDFYEEDEEFPSENIPEDEWEDFDEEDPVDEEIAAFEDEIAAIEAITSGIDVEELEEIMEEDGLTGVSEDTEEMGIILEDEELMAADEDMEDEFEESEEAADTAGVPKDSESVQEAASEEAETMQETMTSEEFEELEEILNSEEKSGTDVAEETVPAYIGETTEEAVPEYTAENAPAYIGETAEEVPAAYTEENTPAYIGEITEEAAPVYTAENAPAYIGEAAEETAPVHEEAPAEEAVSSSAEAPAVKTAPVAEPSKTRMLTRDEYMLFGSFIQNRNSKDQIVHAVENMSLASYTGNVVVTGDEGMNTLDLAKNLIRSIQISDDNFSGKIAKITGMSLNRKDVEDTIGKLENGALIIEGAAGMNQDTADNLRKAIELENRGIVIILEGSKKDMDKWFQTNSVLQENFNIHVDIEALTNDALVAFGRKYAKDKEYNIDEMGILALHTRIADMQTAEHAVTLMDVKAIVDGAIEQANARNLTHFFDILLSKRYDCEDMIVLRERDFV